MKVFVLLFLLFFIITDTGCKKVNKTTRVTKRTDKRRIVYLSETDELVKSIMRLQPYDFKFSRDPFKPLLGGSLSRLNVNIGDEIKIIGVVRLEGIPYVFMETPFKKGVFKKGDVIGEYTIDDIEINRIILKKGDEKLVVKLGGNDEE
ncbi:MAG: hypothetical protein NC817_02015 [Candidatus Omnitrophica bacterium]|nr:hypothetical protein [Candidatus Omnitrophota bacterium]MCM8825969.1 hypothetical protein [Candidatus Omnitrophota bacterium]